MCGCTHTPASFTCKHANPRTATQFLNWALRRGRTSPNKWHVPASRNLRDVQEPFSDYCIVSLAASSIKTCDSFRQIPNVAGREFLRMACQLGRGWYTHFCCAVITAGPMVSLLLAVICGGHHVPASKACCISHGKGLWLEGSLSSSQLLLLIKKRENVREILVI